MKLIDIGANLLDPVFVGRYRGTIKHACDFNQILNKSWNANVDRIIVTAGTLEEASQALEMTQGKIRGQNGNSETIEHRDKLFSTVGIHPTRANAFESDPGLLDKLLEIAVLGKSQGKIVAIGECGLDYARTEFCSKETQLKHFAKHFVLSEKTGLPMFLHCRDAAEDFIEILSANRSRFSSAVVHSFDGTHEELDTFLALGLYIGVNGCSLKTEENIKVVKEIPLDRLMIETDCPWCDIRKTHAGSKYVKTNWEMSKTPSKHDPETDGDKIIKGRNEPCTLLQVLEVVSGARGEDIETVASATFENSMKVFFPNV